MLFNNYINYFVCPTKKAKLVTISLQLYNTLTDVDNYIYFWRSCIILLKLNNCMTLRIIISRRFNHLLFKITFCTSHSMDPTRSLIFAQGR